jgi:hypothetical protein
MRQFLRFHSLSAVILLSVVLRAAVMVARVGAFDDPDNYLPMARSLAAGEGFALRGRPTAYRPPLYPLILTLVAGLPGDWVNWAIGALHLVLGAGTVWMTAAAARGFGLAPLRAMAAASVAACDPVLVWQCRSVMTETPAAFLLAATLAAISLGGWRGAALGGIGFGLAGLCRPSLLAWAAVTIAGALVVQPGAGGRRFLRAAVLSLGLGAVLLPWIIRNVLVFGVPIATTTHGGYTLALANNPVYYRDVLDGPPGRVWTGDDQWRWWDAVGRETAGLSEPAADRYLARAVWRLARAEPDRFARAALARLGHFWSVAPTGAVYSRGLRMATAAWTIPLWVAVALGLCQRACWRWPQVAAPLAMVGLSLVHALFWTDLRMRAPIVPAIAIVAAFACSSALRIGRDTSDGQGGPSKDG